MCFSNHFHSFERHCTFNLQKEICLRMFNMFFSCVCAYFRLDHSVFRNITVIIYLFNDIFFYDVCHELEMKKRETRTGKFDDKNRTIRRERFQQTTHPIKIFCQTSNGQIYFLRICFFFILFCSRWKQNIKENTAKKRKKKLRSFLWRLNEKCTSFGCHKYLHFFFYLFVRFFSWK